MEKEIEESPENPTTPVIDALRSLGNDETLSNLKRLGVNVGNAYGVSIKEIKAIARKIGKSHALAFELWGTKVREARILAGMVDDPGMVSGEQMDHWAHGFDSWDVCDGCCINLFVKTPFAYEKAIAWSSSDMLFVKRAGFVLMAGMAMHDKGATADVFAQFLKIISANAAERRGPVKKAMKWAEKEINLRLKGVG